MAQKSQPDVIATIYKVIVGILLLLVGWMGSQTYQSSVEVTRLRDALAVEKELRIQHLKDYAILNARNRDLSERVGILEDRHIRPIHPSDMP